MRRLILLFFCLLLGAMANPVAAQFRDLNQGNNSWDSSNQTTTEDGNSVPVTRNFSLKTYFRGLAHKDTIPVNHLFFGSMVLPGSAQIYNQDYWKLPILYAGVGGMIYGGHYYNKAYHQSGSTDDLMLRNAFIAGSALLYWGSLLDGVVSYEGAPFPSPGKAALYSALLPGLGQAYNGDYWKIPIFYTGFVISGYAWNYNGKLYKRYKNLYNQATTEDGGYTGHESVENLKHYRNSFRRYRDYSVLATVAIYVLQIIDANVFAMMHDFEVTDDLSLQVGPSIIEPITIPNQYQFTMNPATSSLGMQVRLEF